MILKLIRPKVKKNVYLLGYYHQSPFGRVKYMTPSLALAILASLTPKEVKVAIVDENIENIDFDSPVDFVGITITPYTAKRGYEIADAFRRRDVKVILGGMQVTLAPRLSLKHADSIAIGEAEDIWPRIISDFKKNKLKKVYHSDRFPSLNNRALPRWDLVRNECYFLAPVTFTRGCPYGCEFCVVGTHFGHKVRKRPIKDVIQEIKFLKRFYKNFWFVDYNSFFDKKYMKALLKRLVPLNIRYTCFANAEIHKDEELLELLSQSGCRNISIGFETLNLKNLEAINKDLLNKIEDYPRAIEKIQSYGLFIRGLFIMGMEHDDKDLFFQIESFINKTGLVMPDFFPAVAYKGTDFYKRLIKENKIRRVRRSPCSLDRLINNKITWQDFVIGHAVLLKKVYAFDSVFGRLKKFYEMNNKRVKIKRHHQSLSNVVKKLRLTLWYIAEGDFSRMKFAVKLLWHPKSVFSIGSSFKNVPNFIMLIEWRRSLFTSYLIHPSKKIFNIDIRLLDLIKFFINLLKPGYKERASKQNGNLPFLISMQKWEHKMRPHSLFDACSDSRIKSRFLFFINFLILRSEFKKGMKIRYNNQDEYYDKMVQQ